MDTGNIMTITLARAQEAFECNAATGVLRWKIARPGRTEVGGVAGSLHKKGYWIVKLDGKFYRRSRIVWLLVRGELPRGLLDHKNRNRQDDAIENLREATNSQNQQNNTRCGSTGLKGVSYRKGKYEARITLDGETRTLGRFDSADEAHGAYAAAAYTIFGEFACPTW
jgi:hypothetical protein